MQMLSGAPRKGSALVAAFTGNWGDLGSGPGSGSNLPAPSLLWPQFPHQQSEGLCG